MTFLQRLLEPEHFYRYAGLLAPWLLGAGVILIAVGFYAGLVLSPADYEQGEGFRIIYAHVPNAWLALLVYVLMAAAGTVALVWRHVTFEALAVAAAPLGAAFCFLALVTGAIWGKPMWGAYWVWDARLTAMLLLLFLYLGFIALYAAIDDKRSAIRAAGVLAIVGLVNIPIIRYSVVWWHTLHQPPTVSAAAGSAIHPSMLYPLLITTTGMLLFFGALLLLRARTLLLERERNEPWVSTELGVAH